MNTKKIPSWFKDYELYEEGATVKNPYTGRTYELDALELSIYDAIIGANNIIQSMGGVMNPKTGIYQKEMAKGLSWFRKNNSEAYMVLLD